ncbi:MAG: alpha/beta hydrolase [Burkholderiaceae bacterium]
MKSLVTSYVPDNPNADKVGNAESISYMPVRASHTEIHQLRGLTHHVTVWPAIGTSAKLLWLYHGWMDVGPSFQFVVDELPSDWTIIAPDWRGFGRTGNTGADTYWFMDYLADLDALADVISPNQALNLVGHSMGGNLVTVYAGVRPDRVHRLVNLEGMGMAQTQPADAPARISQWLDEIKTPRRLADYDTAQAVAKRLMTNNPRLTADKAAFMASHWAQQSEAGRYVLRADPQHKGINPYLYRVDETVACWSEITAPMLLVVCEHSNERHAFTRTPEYAARLANIGNLTRARVDGAGHMMHHDQPAAVARLIREFIQ